MPRRLALFGGTFDPPHVGHLAVASEVRHAGSFDEVVFVVSNDPWQKRGSRAITPAEQRLAMVRAAVAGHPGLVASATEIERGGATYTIDTVEQLLATEPDADVSLVLGADAAAGLDSWHRAQELASLVTIAAVGRPGHPDPNPGPGWRVQVHDVPAIDVSSTDLRRRVAEGRPIDFLVTDPVRDLIGDLGLYGVRR